MTIRHRLTALSSLFEYLCERNTVTHNLVKGVKRPAVESYEGKTPALGNHQARKLLDIPDGCQSTSKIYHKSTSKNFQSFDITTNFVVGNHVSYWQYFIEL